MLLSYVMTLGTRGTLWKSREMCGYQRKRRGT
jgi:hypothetical protein